MKTGASVCLWSCVICVRTAAAGGSEALPADVYRGTWGELRPFHQEVFSVATGSQVTAAENGSPTGKEVDNPVLRKVLGNISSPVFRLPGGDGLNNHDYFKDRISLEDWWKMSELGHSIPLWGVNATTASTQATEKMAKALVELGAKTDYFELGNELYLQRWAAQTPTANDYLRKAAPHLALLRKYFPHAKFGVPGGSFRDVVQDARPDREFAIRSASELPGWLKILLAHPEAYDAIVLHLYLTPLEFGPGGLKDRTPEDLARWVWVRSDGDMVAKTFGTIHALAPQKDLWVTEWAFNSTQYVSKTADPRWQVHQTMLAMFYDARFMLNVAYRVPFVTIMTNWTLYSQPAVCLITANGQTTIKYELFRLLRLAREGSDRLARLQIEHNPVWQGPPGGQGYARDSSEVGEVFGFFRGDTLQSAVILNILDHPVTVELPGPPGVLREGLALSQESLLPGWGAANNPPVAKWQPPFSLGAVAVAANRATVPAWSITVLRGGAAPMAGE